MDHLFGATPIFDEMMAERKLEEEFQDRLIELRQTEPIYAEMLEERFYKERTMNNWQRMVNDMREAMELPVPEVPRTLSPKEAELHIKMIRDEFEEEFVPAFLNQDLVEMADAGVDVLVYVIGALSNAGFDIDPLFREVMRSNMSKFDPVTGKAIKAGPNDPDGHPEGKVLKGPAYSPPNLAPIINEQYRFGAEDDTVYRTENTPITLGIGGPKIGEGNIHMDHNGNVTMEATLFDLDELPQIGQLSISDVSYFEAREEVTSSHTEYPTDHPPIPEGWPVPMDGDLLETEAVKSPTQYPSWPIDLDKVDDEPDGEILVTIDAEDGPRRSTFIDFEVKEDNNK